MSNRTDWECVAREVARELGVPEGTDLNRLELELHNAWVAGQEGSPEVPEMIVVPKTDVDVAFPVHHPSFLATEETAALEELARRLGGRLGTWSIIADNQQPDLRVATAFVFTDRKAGT